MADIKWNADWNGIQEQNTNQSYFCFALAQLLLKLMLQDSESAAGF